MGMVGDDGGGKWSVVYIGRTERWRGRYGNDGESLGNPWKLLQGAIVAAQAEVCKRCDALNDDPMQRIWQRPSEW